MVNFRVKLFLIWVFLVSLYICQYFLSSLYSQNEIKLKRWITNGMANVLTQDSQKRKHHKILCWFLTSPDVLEKKARHVRDTWAKHCDIDLYMSSKEDKTFPTIGLNVTEGREHLAEKSRLAWTYVYDHYFNTADYFVKADTDTFIVVENLRKMLQNYDPKNAEFFGHMYYINGKRTEDKMIMAGGPGIVVSKEALRRLVMLGIKNATGDYKCIPDGGIEDVKTCTCMYKTGSRPVNSTDDSGRERFLVWPPHSYILRLLPKWYQNIDGDKGKNQGVDCCSDHPIGFHYIYPQLMHTMYYLFYKTKVDATFRKQHVDLNSNVTQIV
ncbi:unnamed protein product [Owenia fusiformis]|uniref:N-acetylgalactosaminide beta-1,3-galactosyltransferase n=1 Tax=Owenia fusiformis TaxID=6347 RepID=A0A8J1TD05_OWEFU|nr:unnamed protein product [Owenia fusiformis]